MARDHGLGRLKAPLDGRDFLYLMSAAMPQVKAVAPPKPRKRAYNEGPMLNQGAYPYCVGYSAKGFLNAAPIMSKDSAEPTGPAIYRVAQTLDEWPGENYDGSSVRGGMKSLQQLGHISSYVWGQTVDEALAWVNGGFGTVVIGTDWFTLFDDIGDDGFMRMPSTIATPIGGHAYRLNWYDVKKKGFLVINSWGTGSWGYKRSGKAWMTRELLEFLLHRDGEIAAPTQIKIVQQRP